MSKKWLKRILCASLSLLLVVPFVDIAPSAFAATQNELQNQIADLEKKSAELEAEIAALKKEKKEPQKLKNALEKKINNVQKEINLCNSKISNFQVQIKKKEQEIADKNAEMEDNIRMFKNRLRIIYMTGNGAGDANILLGAKDFADFLTLSALTGKVSARDKALMEDITEDIKVIKAQEEEINQYIEQQNAEKAVLSEKKAVLNDDMSVYDNILDELNADQKKLENENKVYEKAIAAIEREIAAANKQAATSGVVYDGSQFTWPTPGFYKVYSGYGMRNKKMHKGIDISQSGINGAKIVSAASGVVITAGWSTGGYGNYVMVNHGTKDGKTYITLYAHMSKITTRVGAQVSKGTQLGNVGSTGRSSGPHLHFEIRVNGNPQNPMNFYSKIK